MMFLLFSYDFPIDMLLMICFNLCIIVLGGERGVMGRLAWRAFAVFGRPSIFTFGRLHAQVCGSQGLQASTEGAEGGAFCGHDEDWHALRVFLELVNWDVGSCFCLKSSASLATLLSQYHRLYYGECLPRGNIILYNYIIQNSHIIYYIIPCIVFTKQKRTYCSSLSR